MASFGADPNSDARRQTPDARRDVRVLEPQASSLKPRTTYHVPRLHVHFDVAGLFDAGDLAQLGDLVVASGWSRLRPIIAASLVTRDRPTTMLAMLTPMSPRN